MVPRPSRSLVLQALSLVVASTSANAQAESSAAPNVVVILTDDQGYADVGFHGSPDIETPHIDRIAAEGVVFTQAYDSYAVCGPSRAGLITGRYQDRFGACRNPTIDPSVPDNGVPRSERMLSELLKPFGYRSIAVGKWHLGSHAGLHPRDRAFDEFFGFLSGGHDYMPDKLVVPSLADVRKRWGWYRTKILHNGERVDIDEYLTDALSGAAVNFIERSVRDTPGQPFFLYLAYNAPHTPLQAPAKYKKRFAHIGNRRRRTYAAMLSAVDDGVGTVLAALRNHGLEDDTLIVFLTDNGGAKNNASDNGGLRGVKGTPYEGGIRTPMAMRWSGVIPPGTVRTDPVISLDIVATVLAACGQHREDLDAGGKTTDGVDLIPYVLGSEPAPPHDRLFWRMYDQGITVIRDGNDKLIVRRDGADEFFRLDRDPGEEHDLIASEDVDVQGRIAALRGRLSAWQRELREPLCPGLGHWFARDR